jgi:L-asparaginase
LFKLTPGAQAETLGYMLAQYDGVVIESFGTGGLPAGFYDTLADGVAAGKAIVMTTQVPNEGSDMEVYHVGKDIKARLGLMEAYDMTLEAVITKLMWILGQTSSRDERSQLLYKTVNYDILIKQ